MIGREQMNCVSMEAVDRNRIEELKRAELYKRCIFEDMKIAIDLLKDFDTKLKNLHPEIYYKIRQLI